ncbi:carbohydrate-binding protein [Streptomyces rubrogriseus]|uniref:carbohydrate-binding protein n=1 Tax=Streptomyces rubrogriseus TaxID=194673 RepID=UPI003701EC40
MRVPRLRAGAVATLATLLAVGGVVPLASPAAAAAVNVSVDLSKSTGALKYGATGFLYGQGSDGVPTDTVLNGLTHLGVSAQMAPDGLQHPSGDALKTAPQWKRNGGRDIQIYMQDIYSQWPYENLGLNDYLNKVDDIVAKVVGDPNRTSFVYVPFNEPDGIWYSNNVTGLQSAWKTVYERIKSLDPGARIAGPNYSVYNSADYRSFMTFAKANNVLPDVTTWHELQNSFYTSWYSHYEDYRDIESDLGISQRPISINEYARASGDLGVPGNLVQFIAKFETSKVDGSLAYWQAAGTLDELVTQNNRATGAWWLYHWYGLMTGNTVNVALANREQSTQALASYDSAKSQARILFGGNGSVSGTYDTTLNLTGLSSTPFSNQAHVTVWGVDSSGSTPSSGPYIVAERDVTASNGTLSMPLTSLKGSSAYYAVVTPNTDLAAASATRYEAEYARLTGPAEPTYGTNSGYQGTGYVWGASNTSKAATSFFVTAPSNGFYNVNIRYAAGPISGAPADRSLRLSLNQEHVKDVALSGTGAWNSWATKTVRMYLPAGINHINLSTYTSDESDVANLDYIELAAATGPSTTTQAESNTNTRAGTAVVESDSSASGGQIVSHIGQGNANTLQFNNVTAAAAGDYTLVLGYANGEVSGGNAFQIVDRFADISVNGAASERVAFANTRGWSNFWTASARVSLSAGNNTIKISNASAWAPNLDYMLVAPTSN